MQVNGTFIHDDRPRNGATAKLWLASIFGSPPEKDDDEPGSGQVGSTITTGVEYGGDGAYRWDNVEAEEYYVSCYYDGHRYWIHFAEEDVDDVLTTQGDMLVQGVSTYERLAIESDGKILKIVSGVPAWATKS